MENVPQNVNDKFRELSLKHGVTFQQLLVTGFGFAFALSGLLDSIYNLRAEVDAISPHIIQPEQPQPSNPQPVHGAGYASMPAVSSGVHIAPPPGMAAHPSMSPTMPAPHPPATSSIASPLAPSHPSHSASPDGLTLTPPITTSALPSPGPALSTAFTSTASSGPPADPPTLSGASSDKPSTPTSESDPPRSTVSSTDGPPSHDPESTPSLGRPGALPSDDKSAASDTTHAGLKSPSLLGTDDTPTEQRPDGLTPAPSITASTLPNPGPALFTAFTSTASSGLPAEPPTPSGASSDKPSTLTSESDPPRSTVNGTGDPPSHNPESTLPLDKPGASPSDDKSAASDTTHTGVKSPSPLGTDDTPTEQRPNVFTNLHPDILALVRRLPEGDIHGVEYHIREGSVHITLEDEGEIQEAISKFQNAYQKIVGHGCRLRMEHIKIPSTCRKDEVEAMIAKFEQQYLSTAFVLDEDRGVIRVISQSRQFDQAKKFLEESLYSQSLAAVAAPPAVDLLAITFAQTHTLTLKRGDIAQEKADILVNAANSHLQHGGGVAGALNAASEGKLQTFCDKYMEKKRKGKEVPVGEVAVTHGGGRLQCTYVVHAVGPDGFVHSTVQCEHLLKQVIQYTLVAAEARNATSIAIPAISSGIFGVSKDLVAHCIIDTILGFHFTKPAPVLSDIRIVILDQLTHSHFAHNLQQKGLVSTTKSAHTTYTHKASLSQPSKEEEASPEGKSLL